MEIRELKEMFSYREHQLESFISEKDEEIDRLKAIIRTLTKTQQIEGGSSLRGSRARETAREI